MKFKPVYDERPKGVRTYRITCEWCGETKNLRIESKKGTGRRKKYCSKECCSAANKKYSQEYCRSSEWLAKRRERYWDKKREEQENNNGTSE